MRNFFGWVMATVALVNLMFGLWAAVNENYAKAAFNVLVAILFTMYENQVSREGWWSQ